MSSQKVSVAIGKSEGESVRGGVSERERPDLPLGTLWGSL